MFKLLLLKSVRNYISGVYFLHKQLGREAVAMDSVPVTSLLQAAELSMRTQQLRHLPILPNLLHQLCSLVDNLRQLGITSVLNFRVLWYASPK